MGHLSADEEGSVGYVERAWRRNEEWLRGGEGGCVCCRERRGKLHALLAVHARGVVFSTAVDPMKVSPKNLRSPVASNVLHRASAKCHDEPILERSSSNTARIRCGAPTCRQIDGRKWGILLNVGMLALPWTAICSLHTFLVWAHGDRESHIARTIITCNTPTRARRSQ